MRQASTSTQFPKLRSTATSPISGTATVPARSTRAWKSTKSTENLQSALSSGSHDIVIAPINLGAKLYLTEKSNYQIGAVITTNNAYIVTKASNKLDGIEDLIGKNVVGFGKAGVPGNLLKHLYYSNEQLDNSVVENNDNWYSSSAEVYGLFKGGTVEYALMSEPEISKLRLVDKIEVNVLDLCELLEIEIVPQACVFVNPRSTKQEQIKNTLKLIEDNIKSLNENPKMYANKIIPLHKYFQSTGEEVIANCIPSISISYIEANSIQDEILDILLLLDPTSSKIPDEKFYYKK